MTKEIAKIKKSQKRKKKKNCKYYLHMPLTKIRDEVSSSKSTTIQYDQSNNKRDKIKLK